MLWQWKTKLHLKLLSSFAPYFRNLMHFKHRKRNRYSRPKLGKPDSWMADVYLKRSLSPSAFCQTSPDNIITLFLWVQTNLFKILHNPNPATINHSLLESRMTIFVIQGKLSEIITTSYSTELCNLQIVVTRVIPWAA